MSTLAPAELHDPESFAPRLADAAGDVILPYFRKPQIVENKQHGTFDPVTAADKRAETTMPDLIKRDYPEHGIFGEEHGV